MPEGKACSENDHCWSKHILAETDRADRFAQLIVSGMSQGHTPLPPFVMAGQKIARRCIEALDTHGGEHQPGRQGRKEGEESSSLQRERESK